MEDRTSEAERAAFAEGVARGEAMMARVAEQLNAVGEQMRAIPDDPDNPTVAWLAKYALFGQSLDVVTEMERDARAALGGELTPDLQRFVDQVRETLVQGRHDVGARLAVEQHG
jgi:hypothetical protein